MKTKNQQENVTNGLTFNNFTQFMLAMGLGYTSTIIPVIYYGVPKNSVNIIGGSLLANKLAIQYIEPLNKLEYKISILAENEYDSTNTNTDKMQPLSFALGMGFANYIISRNKKNLKN